VLRSAEAALLRKPSRSEAQLTPRSLRSAPLTPPRVQTSILVRNLPREVRPDDVREQFSRFGAQAAEKLLRLSQP